MAQQERTCYQALKMLATNPIRHLLPRLTNLSSILGTCGGRREPTSISSPLTSTRMVVECVCVCGVLCGGAHATTGILRSKDNFVELFLSFHLYMGPRI